MSDLDQRLSAMLADVAHHAPRAAGLASAARRRQRARRRRRLAGGTVAAVLVAATVGATWGRDEGGDDHVAHDPAEPRSADGWSEISDGEHVFSVPAGWLPVDCKDGLPPIYAAPDADPCADGQGARLGTTEEIDLGIEPGAVVESRPSGRSVWSGVVGVGQDYLSVSSADLAVARRILASGRLAAVPAVDAKAWVEFSRSGLTYEVPEWWGVGQDGSWSAYSVCLVPAGTETPEGRTDRFVMSQTPGPDGTIVVTAPTQAVAELVMATVQVDDGASPGPCTPEEFAETYDRVEVDGIDLEVPSGWTVKDDCNGIVEISSDDGCGASLNAGSVRFYEEALFDPMMEEREIVGGTSGEPWVGFVRRGEYAVYIAHADRNVVEDLLDRVR